MLRSLQEQAERAALPASSQTLLRAEATLAIEPLLTRGKQVAALGSQMHVERRIDGEDFAVKVICHIGRPQSSPRRFLQRFRWW